MRSIAYGSHLTRSPCGPLRIVYSDEKERWQSGVASAVRHTSTVSASLEDRLDAAAISHSR